MIYRRIIHFGDDAVPKREPNPAGRGVGSSYSILATVSPFGLDARPSESRAGFFWLPIVLTVRIVCTIPAISTGGKRRLSDFSRAYGFRCGRHFAAPLLINIIY